jgi:bacillithiol biosynthesis cysteine-adding enzyme BshC
LSADLKTPARWQRAFLRQDERVLPLYRTDWRDAARERDAWNPLSSEDLAEWKQFLREHGAEEQHLAPLDQMASATTLAVVTGQQAGAALGPLYTIHKALATRHWAEQVAQESGRPCLPLFWVASDDHDLTEVADAVWLGQQGVRRHRLARAGGGDRSVFHEPIDRAAAETYLADLESETPPTEFRPGVLADLRDALLDGNFEGQFVRLFVRWLLPLGIFPVVPRLGFLRQRAVSILKREIETAPLATQEVLRLGEHLSALGADPLLHRRGDERNFFMEVDQRRLKAEGSAEELLGQLHREPAVFSANAILRPLVQDLAFPTVATIVGPGELLYHAQLGPLYGQFGVTRPALIPRPNVMLLDGKAERALQKLGVPASALVEGSNPLLPLQSADRQQALDAFDGHRATLHEDFRRLQEWVRQQAPDPATQKQLEKMEQNLEQSWLKLAERVGATLDAKAGDFVIQRERAAAVLFPEGSSQERILGVVAPFLIQYGPELLRKLADVIGPPTDGIQVISVQQLMARNGAGE